MLCPPQRKPPRSNPLNSEALTIEVNEHNRLLENHAVRLTVMEEFIKSIKGTLNKLFVGVFVGVIVTLAGIVAGFLMKR
jgi:hypothetical protein